MGMFYMKGGTLDHPKTEYCVFFVTTKCLWLIVFVSGISQKKDLSQECFFLFTDETAET